jgi:outer membrane immunogenic protein
MKIDMKFARPIAAAFGLVALLGVIPANAADVIGEEPPAPAAPVEEVPLNTWSGPYAGVTAGYGFAGRTRADGNTIDTDGFIGGGFAGINGQAGQIVYGAEADVGYNGMKGTNAGTTSKNGLEGSLRARLGYAVTDDVLLYATGGGAAGRMKISDAAGEDTQTMLGYTAGVGVDAKITGNVFGRAEYRYTDYGRETFNTGSGAQNVDSRDNRIGLGVGIKF